MIQTHMHTGGHALIIVINYGQDVFTYSTKCIIVLFFQYLCRFENFLYNNLESKELRSSTVLQATEAGFLLPCQEAPKMTLGFDKRPLLI